MIGRLLATTALLAVLVTGATIGLEAVGLLFQGGAAPRQTVANLHTQLDPLRDPEAMLLRPLEALDRARAPKAENDTARREAADPFDGPREVLDEKRYLADALRWAERYRRDQEAKKRVATVPEPAHPVAERPAPAADAGAEWKGPAQDAWAPKVIAAATEPEGRRSNKARVAEARPPEPPASRGASRSAHQPPARPHRARSRRTSAGRGGGPSCPFLGWLQALL